MNREVLSKYDVMTVGEGGGVAVEDALNLVGDDRHELQTFFQFELVDRWGRRPGNWLYPDSTNRSLPELKRMFTKWDSVFATSGWGTVFLGNHDQSRDGEPLRQRRPAVSRRPRRRCCTPCC